MQYIVCNQCGFMNEPIDNSCKRCQAALEGISPLSAEDAAAASRQFQYGSSAPHFNAAGAASSAIQYVTSNLKPLSGEYPWAHRYITWLQSSAMWWYILHLAVALLVVLAILGSGMDALRSSGGVVSKTVLVGGHILFAVVAGVIGFFIARFNYMLMMALPDFLTCFLRIEANTRGGTRAG